MQPNNLPTVVYHADWGADSRKRWFSRAVQKRHGFEAHAPELVDDHLAFISRIRTEVGMSGAGVVGFDFPIGIPARYAAMIGAAEFKPFLLQLGRGKFQDFYHISERASDISKHRPFYPYRPGGTRHRHLLSALGLTCMNDLRRKCDLGYAGRKAACPLFWTLGANQVGRAAINGWRDVLVPALNNATSMFWPFDGSIDSLLMPGNVVIVETYPAECYSWFFQEQTLKSKTSLDARRQAGPALLSWAQSAKVGLDSELQKAIEEGFPDGDDAFDAVVGLFGMLEVLMKRRPSGEPGEDAVRLLEGWIFGQACGP